MIISPSTPRLSTLGRSTTSSPAAASRSGVEAASTARMMASRSPMGCLAMTRHEPELVKDERIARQHVEQEDALEHLGEIERDAHGNLGLFAADEGEREKQPCNEDADRVHSAEERHDDCREPVARRNIRPQISDRPGHFNDAGEAGKRS